MIKIILGIMQSRIKVGSVLTFFNLLLHYILLKIKKIFKIGFYDNYQNKIGKVDIVIPTVSKDYLILEKYLNGLKSNLCHNINKIYVVSFCNDEIIDFCNKHDLIFIDESAVLGYNKDYISRQFNYVVDGYNRNGWIFQQLLKLSCEKFVEMENYIIIDSDTILINPTSFMTNDKFIFFENEEWHQPYFRAFKKMFGYDVKTRLSFTSHMMIFNIKNLKLMKLELEKKHGKSWDKIYLSNINQKEISCISDYETYANWVLYNYPETVSTKPLYNKTLSRKELSNLNKYKNKYKTISFHSYAK